MDEPDGPVVVELSGKRELRWPHSMTFKLNDDQIERALDLRATFPGNTWAEVGRWLFSSPHVGDVIAKRVRGEI